MIQTKGNIVAAKSPILLGVNIDHVATLRQARMTRYPEPVQAALIAEQAGADGITAHLREDRRHIQDRDIRLLREMLHSRLNLEMAVIPEMVDFACEIRPQACCLVPERRQELTTEGGLDVKRYFEEIQSACARLASKGCRVSLFIDPDFEQIDAAVKARAPVVELHTGTYADAENETHQAAQLDRLRRAAVYAASAGLQVNAGHGLDYHNVTEIARIPEIVELNIGHSIIARAVITGLHSAVGDMKRLMIESRLL
ncbi:MAG: pyridoxine 5'-phosphate synthase [Gammaproteobacteria bacterium]